MKPPLVPPKLLADSDVHSKPIVLVENAINTFGHFTALLLNESRFVTLQQKSVKSQAYEISAERTT